MIPFILYTILMRNPRMLDYKDNQENSNTKFLLVAIVGNQEGELCWGWPQCD